ncbi:glutamate decarboxylase 1 [Phyllopteryx taeniolatus]|uniref:glutamate decarboxylase 1 n=1 Tax=Phyllopteryx taeniolatus TaxID=161469 RepID=UPI002AD32958|nr:glutamate decarboxylase 1 [Phyllopteryx taeniolatus]
MSKANIGTDMDFLQLSDGVTGESTKTEKHPVESLREKEPTLTDFSNIYCKDLLPTLGGEGMTREFLQEIVNLLINYICKSYHRNSKVLDFHHPHQLKEGLEGFSLDLPERPDTLEQILVDCRDTLKYGVSTGHPRFFNQLFAGLDVIGVAGEWLTSIANTNMFTYEVSPVFTLMEEILLKKMQSIVRWSEDEGDGIFSPGGTISNLYSMLVARYYFYPEVKTRGMGAVPHLALFTSEHSHYSVKKSAAVLGLGIENVLLVKCDERGKMIPEELEASILAAVEKNMVPFYVNATAGTTLYGAFDPLDAIADICQRRALWMHVDASWGGGLLLSDRHRTKLQGIERAWSVTWNPHKMMGVPLQCSAILIKKKGLLQQCNELGAPYLFQKDKFYDVSYDTGDKSIQCGRHVDVFKLWLMWKAKGTEGFGAQVNKCLGNAEYLHDRLQKRKDFELVFQNKPEHSNVCFWYIPPSLRSVPPGAERDERLSQVAPQIKGRLMEKGSVLIGYQPTSTKVNFFRCVFANPATQREDIDFLLEEINRVGRDL